MEKKADLPVSMDELVQKMANLCADRLESGKIRQALVDQAMVTQIGSILNHGSLVFISETFEWILVNLRDDEGLFGESTKFTSLVTDLASAVRQIFGSASVSAEESLDELVQLRLRTTQYQLLDKKEGVVSTEGEE